jgi:hypothetical protein
MARLSKANKYAILWLKSQNKSNEDIQKELDVTMKQIESVDPIQTQESQSENSNARKTSKDFMIHETANRINSVAIMTKEASSMNDDFKKANKPDNTSRNQNNIHKIS